ncbi:MAG: Kelch repeat-containing protein [Nitrospinales bacterium]
MFRLVLSTLITLVLFSGSVCAEVFEGFWKAMPPAPTARTEGAAAFLDGKIYVIGGFTSKGIADKVEVLDLKTGSWAEVSPLPRPLHHTSALAVNGRIYVIGGFHSGLWTPVASVYEYDPAADQWREKRSMPTARGAMAAGVIGGKIYVVGGAHKKFLHLVNTDANEVYDPAADRWRKLRPIPTPRDHLTVSTYKGILYAIGGRVDVDYQKNLNRNEAYDPKTDRWTQRNPLPTARSGIASQVLDGKIFVMGGEAEGGTFRENEAYDPETDSWTVMQPMPEGRHGLGSAVVADEIHTLTGGPKPGGGGSGLYRVFSLKKP